MSSFVVNVQPFTGGWSGYLTVEQARTLVADGHEIVSHGMEHLSLSGLTREEVERQMRESRTWLEENLHTPVHHYAAPNGEFGATGMEVAKSYYDSYRGATGGMTYAGADPPTRCSPTSCSRPTVPTTSRR